MDDNIKQNLLNFTQQDAINICCQHEDMLKRSDSEKEPKSTIPYQAKIRQSLIDKLGINTLNIVQRPAEYDKEIVNCAQQIRDLVDKEIRVVLERNC